MASKVKKPDEGGPKVPAYIVTFSDMVTLLLTFFVMLLSLANDQDPELFNKSRDAFVESINNIGLGMLEGQKSNPELGSKLIKHSIRNPDDESDLRTIDADEEQRRRVFRKVTESMDVLKSQIVADEIQYSVARVSFADSQYQLNSESKKNLDQFARNLSQDAQADQIKLYVLGIASDAIGRKNQWIISAQRAQEVAAYLKRVLPQTGQYPVFAWGAGSGGTWVQENGFASKDGKIFIGVLK